MNIFNGFLASLQKKSAPPPVTTPGVSTVTVGFSRNDCDAPVNERSVLALSSAWACVNLNAGTVGSLPLMVYRTDSDGKRQPARDHPLYRLLHDSPNYDQTAIDFWEGGQIGLELRGSMFARKEMTGKRVSALLPFCNPLVTRTSSGSIRYQWNQDGKSYDEPQENVFHVRGFGSTPLGGMSPLQYCRPVYALATAVNTAATSHFRNGARPSLALTTDKILGDKREEIEEGLAVRHQGVMNAGRPLLLEGGMIPHNLSFSPEDAQMLQSRDFSVGEICSIYGVPPIMIGRGEKTSSWGTGVQEVISAYYKFALRVRLVRIEQAIKQQLLTAEDRAQGVTVEFNIEGLLRGDSAARAAFYEIMIRSGIMTRNECRALENLPPVEGGDIIRVQMQDVPLTQMGHNGGPPLDDEK
ncbi:phage portal protein [Asticcacaulis sp.]|uniref:phage portal protein n=1 Tax=Asticcacaulis sp. TaxID=1872648 RepID=UPI003F7B94BE